MVKSTRRKRRIKPPKVIIDPDKRIWAFDLRRKIIEISRDEDTRRSGVFLEYATFQLAAYILVEFLGDKWLNYYVGHRGLILKSSYFGDTDTFFLRVQNLAEMILNLQDVPAFSSCLEQLAGGEIESAYAELEVGKFLFWFNARFRFNKPIRQPKADFDLHVVFKNGNVGYGEIKSKRESEPLPKSGVLNSLRIARDQFPSDKPGVIFLKIPEAWIVSENRRLIDEQVNEFLRNTEAIVAVELFSTGFKAEWDATEPIVGGVEVLNYNHRFDRALDWSLIGNVVPEPRGFLPPPWWRSISALIDPAVDPRRWRP
jgi:hypothetical protein